MRYRSENSPGISFGAFFYADKSLHWFDKVYYDENVYILIYYIYLSEIIEKLARYLTLVDDATLLHRKNQSAFCVQQITDAHYR